MKKAVVSKVKKLTGTEEEGEGIPDFLPKELFTKDEGQGGGRRRTPFHRGTPNKRSRRTPYHLKESLIELINRLHLRRSN